VLLTASGVIVAYNIHPEHHTANLIVLALGTAGFLAVLPAWFPRKYMYVADRKNFAAQRPPWYALYAVAKLTDGKVLVVRSYALAGAGLSMLAYAGLVLATVVTYS